MAALLVLVLLAVPHRWGLAEAGLLRERHRQGHNAINIGTDRVSECIFYDKKMPLKKTLS